MDMIRQFLIAIGVLIAAILIGFLCRRLSTKLVLPVAATLGALVGGAISVIGLRLNVPAGLILWLGAMPPENQFPSMIASWSIGGYVLIDTLLGGLWASLIASDTFRASMWKLQFGENGMRVPVNVAEENKLKADDGAK